MNFNEFYTREKELEYFQNLSFFIENQRQNHIVYPRKEEVFRAFELCDFDETKIVIIGQDPYHQKGQANGLAFSVNKEMKLPPSLRNIFKELESDLGIKNTNGDLTNWAKQGILLLNTTLTVRDSEPMSHQKKGWEIFTSKWIEHLSENKEGLIFVLWGKHAQSLMSVIDSKKHLILKSVHPSPLSASRGFFGSRVFSKINNHISIQIDWSTQ